MTPTEVVSEIIKVPTLVEICLRHDLGYAYGDPGNEDFSALALQPMGAVVCKFEDSIYQMCRLWPQQDFPRLGQVFESCRQVDGVTQRAGVGRVE